ncbi:unnamed protein product, partial [Prunus brigantina]
PKPKPKTEALPFALLALIQSIKSYRARYSILLCNYLRNVYIYCRNFSHRLRSGPESLGALKI